MKKDKWYHIFGCYLRQNLCTALMFLGFIGIFSAIFRLYDLEVETIWYCQVTFPKSRSGKDDWIGYADPLNVSYKYRCGTFFCCIPILYQ